MYFPILKSIHKLEGRFRTITPGRKTILERIATYIQAKYEAEAEINLVFICTHNSRRSHFGQIAAAIAADYYCIDRVHVFSGGTEATAFHPNGIKALRSLGFRITSSDETVKNPIWEVRWGVQGHTHCFSKTFDDPANPTSHFAAIMTCTDADENCPFVPGTELRVSTPYLDPKASDGTPAQDDTYRARFEQIATEMLYVFSRVR